MKKALTQWSLVLLVSSTLVVLCGCTTVPETGRRQLVLISASQETQLGLQSFQDTKKELPVSSDADANALLQKVGKKIAAVAAGDMPNAQWEFVLFESKEANAFCLPGGKVGVHTGILPITKDEAGLATVVGHEVAHAVARHGAERMSEAMVMETGGSLLGTAVSSADPRWQALTALAYGVGTKLGRELPHSRSQELEADNIGLIYLARAGYDPETALKFWERFAEHARQEGDEGLWFLRTHPVDEQRLQQIRQLMPRARAEYEKSRAAGP